MSLEISNIKKLLSQTKYWIRRGCDYIPFKIRQQKLKKWFLSSKYVDELRALKDIHKGERCFLIGNGPSLKLEDLDNLKDEYTFACNKIYKTFEDVKWRPTYYAVADSDRFGKHGLVTEDCENIVGVDSKIRFVGIENTYSQKKLYENSDVIIYRKETHMKKNYPYVSEDISYAVYGGHTILFDAAQIAIYMGFSEIYILGVDANYTFGSNQKSHFYKSDDKAIQNINPGDKMQIAFKSLKDFAETKNVKIYNATRGGKLEVFERVTLEEVLGNE